MIMKFRTFVVTTAYAVALSIAAYGPAHATIVESFAAGTVSVSESITTGGPGISSISPSSSLTGVSIPTGNYSFTLSPAGSCSGSGCSNQVETDHITVTFTGLKVTIAGT